MAGILIVLAALVACGGKPGDDSLRASFATQLAANRFVKTFTQSADGLRFSGPGARGETTAAWRVRIDSASVEANDDPSKPYKGVVKATWFANDQPIAPRGRDSNLPLELTSNGLAQECWAFWDRGAGAWTWE